MNDRELLELAAKAAGQPFDSGYFEEAKSTLGWWGWIYVDGSGEPPNDSAWTELWNPLTDDGDALRLAVKLSIRISPIANQNDCVAGLTFEPGGVFVEHRGEDAYAATRRAIVRAAAEIGKEVE